METFDDTVSTDNPGVVLSLENLYLTYQSGDNSVAALENINLKIYEGEFVCVLGPSGCGKSTLLKIMAGFIQPTGGRITMDGQAIKGPDWHRGVVFQQPPLYPWLNVEENIRFGLKMRNIPKEESQEIVHAYLDKVRLKEFSRMKTYELSGGMKQRVAIARVLVNSPRVLLMDEPFASLDALTREQMQNLVRNIWWESRKTVLFITHDVDEALSLGTRILVMTRRPGRIAKEFRVDFTNTITPDSSDMTRASKHFQQLRRTLVDLISIQNDISYSI